MRNKSNRPFSKQENKNQSGGCIIELVAKQKMNWAGHGARQKTLMNKAHSQWRPPRQHKRNVTYLQKRWLNNIKNFIEMNWDRIADDMEEWSGKKEAYVQE